MAGDAFERQFFPHYLRVNLLEFLCIFIIELVKPDPTPDVVVLPEDVELDVTSASGVAEHFEAENNTIRQLYMHTVVEVSNVCLDSPLAVGIGQRFAGVKLSVEPLQSRYSERE